MFYKFDKNSLVWKKDWKKTKVAASVVLVLMFASFILGRFAKFQTLDEYEKELVVISLEKEKSQPHQHGLPACRRAAPDRRRRACPT